MMAWLFPHKTRGVIMDERKIRFLSAGVAVMASLLLYECSRPGAVRPVDEVDPFICTLGDHGQLFPGAVVPFGMVKLGPDTYPSSFDGDGDLAHSGYNYADTLIRGFSHIRRESSGGTAIYDRGWYVSILPQIGRPCIDRTQCAVAIDKKSETARPGYYAVRMKNPEIQVELTAQTHSALHRYRFPASEQVCLTVDPGSPAFVRSAEVQILGSDGFSGKVDGYQGPVYFWAKLSKPFASFAVWDSVLYSQVRRCQAKRAGLALDFHTREGEEVYLKIGFSLLSEERARLNLEAEIPDWDFSAVREKARKSWSAMLDRITVEGDAKDREIFYTALYHACQQPSDVTDVDGTYLGFDQKPHQAQGFRFHENYAFWDDYRTKFPLMSLINPATFTQVFRSIMEIYDQSSAYWFYSNPTHKVHVGGFVVQGADGFTPFLTCRYEHMMTVVLDAFAKGLASDDFLQQAYRGMQQEALVQMPVEYDRLGFIPTRPDQTFEYSYDNWCVAQMARRLGNAQDYDYFSKRAGYYRNVWDASIGFLRARDADGAWLDFPEDPAVNREKYKYEGSPWQWRWFVPHDVPGMIEMMGGKEKFVEQLDYFFSHHLYQAGNQPDIHAPFLFNYAGAAWLTQKWVRTLLAEPMLHRYAAHEFYPEPIFDRVYKNTPDGYLLEMDDDYGCMASWYVMSAMGLYQMCPGLPVYQLTAPIFKRVTLHLDGDYYSGKSFTIRADNLSRENIYIQSATLNGAPYNQSSITHEAITRGGELCFRMGPQPNKEWAK
jgi:predicted alpha-1,2-mannosidase